MKKRHLQKLVLLSLLLAVAYNIPFVLLFNHTHKLFGFPIIYVYLFGLWLLTIIISFWIVKKYHE